MGQVSSKRIQITNQLLYAIFLYCRPVSKITVVMDEIFPLGKKGEISQ